MRRTSCVALAILLAACVDTDPTNIATPSKQFDHTTDPYAGVAGVGNYHLGFDHGGFESTWKGSGALFNSALTFGTSGADIHFLNTRNGGNDVAFAGLAVRIEPNSHGADMYTATIFGDAPSQALGPKASLGIVTLRETFSFADANNDDYVIVKYSLTNSTNVDHNNLQLGYFADIDFNDPSTAVDETGQNVVSYDATSQVARVTTAGLTAQHLTGFYDRPVTTFNTVNNGAEPTTNPGWFSLFTSGIGNGSGPADIRHYLGVAPITLRAGETQSLVVIMAAGEDASSASANLAAARAKAATLATPTAAKSVAVDIEQLPAAFYATMTFASSAQAASFDAANTQCAGAPLTVTSVNANKVTASFATSEIDRT
ncbi:MAG TPA: hypothetical protein VM100_07705, partial [Longimicrobiales bacterium]|nr:hypothetical protein [Longimicrobiales bacterium]